MAGSMAAWLTAWWTQTSLVTGFLGYWLAWWGTQTILVTVLLGDYMACRVPGYVGDWYLTGCLAGSLVAGCMSS